MPLHLDGEPADCRCFFKVLNTRTRSGLVVRNCWLLLMTFAVLVGRPNASWIGVVLGGAVLGGTLLLTTLMDRIKGVGDQVFVEDGAPEGQRVVAFSGALANRPAEGGAHDE